VLLVSLLALGNVLTMQLLLRQSDNLAATMNLAGKMRMLGQRIALEALAEQRHPDDSWPTPRERYATFESTYAALRDGGSAYGLEVQPLDARLQPALQALHEGWLRYRLAIDALLLAPPMASAQVMSVMAASEHLLARTEALMDRLVQFADDAHQRALMSSLALFALDVLLLLLGYALLSRRVLRPIHVLTRQCREMALGRYGTRTRLSTSDELGELARVLDHSAAHIAQLLQDVAQERSALAQMQAMFNGLAENTVAGIYMLDESGRIIYANEQLAQILGYGRAQLSDRFPMERLFPPPARAAAHQHSARHERSALRADGSKIEIEIFGSAMTFQGRPAVIGLVMDITERKRAEMSARRAALVYQHTSEAMVVTDAQGVVQDINPAFTAITGYEAADILGRRMNVLSSGRQDRAFYEALWTSLRETGSWSGDMRNRRKNGEEFVERLTISTSYNEDGSVHSHIGLFADVTEARRREASIWRQAHYDHLTQLPNRQMFQQDLQRSMDSARASDLPLALVFLDLDYFKEVNDTFGHDMGDELLRQVARRLQSCVRSSDQVARLGGDEFTLILRDLKRLEDAPAICRKVLHAVAQPYELSGSTVHVSVSAGVTFYPRDGDDGVTLLKHADLAMYAAKEQGRNQFCEFAPTMEQEAQNRRLLLRDLQQGLDEGEFALHYQPIVEMRSGRTVKAEALLRWNQPVRGMVSPADFIALAEESGLIVPLGDWVMREAACQLAQWREEIAPAFRLSVNVSPVQLNSSGHCVQAWVAHLQDLSLPGSALVAEITERVLLEADKDTDARLQTLQGAGIQLALDDFGTGYSSLSYLKRFDIDYIKIDRSFVSLLSQGNEDATLCQAIIAMAHQLGICVVAEGVETREQHDILQRAGCDYGQGYWYGRPMPAQELTERLRAQHRAPQPAPAEHG
jgi:diguanylate cyclase (GGDEF)-like protein/PAS domain S-box-containing protein